MAAYGAVETEYQNVNTGETRWSSNKKAKLIGIIALVGAVVTVATVLVVVFALRGSSNDDNPVNPPGGSLEDAMSIQGLMRHLNSLQNIASVAGNTRAVGTLGYNTSVEYVLDELKKTNYAVQVQTFGVPMFVEVDRPFLGQISPVVKNYTENVDFDTMGGYAGKTTLEREVSPIANFGCETSDYEGFIQQSIALVRRTSSGNCTFVEKVQLAQSLGAAAIIIYNQGDTNSPDRNNPFTGDVGTGVTIPVFSMSYPLGSALSEIENLTLSLYIYTSSYIVQTFNIIADTQQGDPNSIIVIGSHLDSVPAGPGINDNGSGSSTNLELAIQLSRLLNADTPLNLVNKVRFCWWGAEERGLLGSTFYVQSLNATQLSQISMNINLDMVGSPNYYRGIYNGSSAADINIRNGSTAIQYKFQKAFQEDQKLTFDLSDFNGRSDYGPFIANGIPAGGLETGAEKLKTAAGRTKYGGLANAPYDPCYHQYCDTVDNINQVILLQNAKAAAYALSDFVVMKDLKSYLKNFIPL